MKIDKLFSEEHKGFVLRQIHVTAECLYQCAKQACENGNPVIVAGFMREYDAIMRKALKIERMLNE